MYNFSFRTLENLCIKNIGSNYVHECLDIQKNSDCIFHSGIIGTKDHIATLYNLRFEIAKELNSFTDNYLRDFENCVFNLKNSTSKDLGITILYSEYNCFIIFYEPYTETILGVLKGDNPEGLKKIEINNLATISKGYSSGIQKYSKGQLVETWE